MATAKFLVQYDDGPALEIEVELPPLRAGQERTPEQEAAVLRELAWDEYKHRTKSERRPSGVRRRPIAEAAGEIDPPRIDPVEQVEPAEQVQPVLTPGGAT